MSVLAWLRNCFRKRPPPSGPLHLFIETGDRWGYGGIVASEKEGSDRAQVYMATECMRTGESAFARYWMSRESELNGDERAFVKRCQEKDKEETN